MHDYTTRKYVWRYKVDPMHDYTHTHNTHAHTHRQRHTHTHTHGHTQTNKMNTTFLSYTPIKSM